jgi:5-methyltetrahydrofolate--homocysteine methyltransferase
MGTMLQKAGLEPGRCPEALNITDPDVVTGIHRAYIDAGSEIIYANTFGGNRYKVRDSGYTVTELVTAGIRCAKAAAAGTNVRVALDVGPIGQLLEPYGPLRFDEAYDIFREMLTAGQAAGADLVIFETMTDLYEVKAAVLAARENTALPIFVTMTFEHSGRTFTGCSISAMAAVLNGLDVDAMGINCSLGPGEILPMARELCALTDKPVIIKANAGLPDPATGKYDITAQDFAEAMLPYQDLGVAYMGGCCGTEPDYIRALVSATAGETGQPSAARRRSVVCTPTRVVELDGVRVIGERINPTGKKRFKQAILEGDMDYIVRQAVEQADAGAHILDVNVGVPGIDEAAMMVRAVRAIQAVTDLPLQIDSSNVQALEAGLRVVNGKAIINSVNGEQEKLEAILPLAKKYGAAVVGLAMDENGIPATAEERFAIAERILNAALECGIPREDVYIDCLTLTVSQDKARETLKAMTMVRDKLGLHCVLGVSNISFGLPERDLITSGFLTLALANGLDLPIVNPNSESIMDAIRVFNVLYGHDRNAEEYIAACARKPKVETVQKAAPAQPGDTEGDQPPLARAVARGLKEDCRRLTRELLESGTEEIEIVNTLLIPALDRVGAAFERGELFLPQLINAATAATEAFELIKTSIAKKGAAGVSKGKIIVATVKGDIHDIGKNIVKTILENYGYTVVDLGRDVPPEAVVRAAVEQDVRLIGLSALMTTTLGSMEETIRALRASGHKCAVWVGGAVLTPDYAKRIGADYYARDAKASVDIAKKVLG